MRTRSEPTRTSREEAPRRRREEEALPRRSRSDEESTPRSRRSEARQSLPDEDRAPLRRSRRDEEPRRAPIKRAVKSTRGRASITEGLRPMRESLTKAERYEAVAAGASEATGREYNHKDAKAILDEFERQLFASVKPKSVGEFTWSGVLKVVAKSFPSRKIPARKAGEYPNPFNGGAMEWRDAAPAKVKPATVKAKILPQLKLKKAVLGQ